MNPSYKAKAFINAKLNDNEYYFESYFFNLNEAMDFINDLSRSGWEIYNSDIKKIETNKQAYCKDCKKELNGSNYDGNGEYLCNPCYDDQFSGCCGGGCRKD
jgi:hypothetical protein